MHWLCSIVNAIWFSVVGYGHAKTRSIFASGAALFSDGYANAVIGPVGTILRGYIYPEYFATETGLTYSSLISSMAFAGIIIGQLSMSGISHVPQPTTRMPRYRERCGTTSAIDSGVQSERLGAGIRSAYGTVADCTGFGWISDKIGRKFGMLVCTLIVFIFSALCAASKGPGVQGTVNALIAFRFFIGAFLLRPILRHRLRDPDV